MAVALTLGALATGLAISLSGEDLPSGAVEQTEAEDSVEVSIRDIEGRILTLPGGREGVIVFTATQRCEECVQTARAVDAAARAQDPPLPVTIVGLQPDASKGDFERFDREAGGLAARYALDDASRSIATSFGVREVNTVLAYSEQGLTTDLIEPGPEQVTVIRGSLGE